MRWPSLVGWSCEVVRARRYEECRAVCSQAATTDVRAFGGAVLCASGGYDEQRGSSLRGRV